LLKAPISLPNIVRRIEQTSPRFGLIPKIGQVAKQLRKTLKHSRASVRLVARQMTRRLRNNVALQRDTELSRDFIASRYAGNLQGIHLLSTIAARESFHPVQADSRKGEIS